MHFLFCALICTSYVNNTLAFSSSLSRDDDGEHMIVTFSVCSPRPAINRLSLLTGLSDGEGGEGTKDPLVTVDVTPIKA